MLGDFEHQQLEAAPHPFTTANVDDLMTRINDFKQYNNLFQTSAQQFTLDWFQARTAGHGFFRATILPALVDRWRLDEYAHFIFDSDHHLRAHAGLLELPGRPDPGERWRSLEPPRPDLAIYFDERRLFLEEEPPVRLPNPIIGCISGGGGFEGVFPFVFAQGGKLTLDHRLAASRNIHAASQALFNVARFMDYGGGRDWRHEFIEKVRVFSLVMVPDQFSVNMHRARLIPGPGGLRKLEYLVTEIFERWDHGRDPPLPIVRNMLQQYGLRQLAPILRVARYRVFRRARADAGVAVSAIDPGRDYPARDAWGDMFAGGDDDGE